MMRIIRYMNTHYELYPLAFCVSFASGLAVFFLGKTATRSPDVAWNRSGNPNPWLNVKATDQYKLHTINVDHSKMTDPVPPESRAAIADE